MPNDRILSGLGLAQKAGFVVSGEFAVEKAVKAGQAYLVIAAEDASDNTKKMLRNMTAFYDTPLYEYGNKETLAHCIGKEIRAMAAVTDSGFAKSLIKQLENRRKTE